MLFDFGFNYDVLGSALDEVAQRHSAEVTELREQHAAAMELRETTLNTQINVS